MKRYLNLMIIVILFCSCDDSKNVTLEDLSGKSYCLKMILTRDKREIYISSEKFTIKFPYDSSKASDLTLYSANSTYNFSWYPTCSFSDNNKIYLRISIPQKTTYGQNQFIWNCPDYIISKLTFNFTLMGAPSESSNEFFMVDEDGTGYLFQRLYYSAYTDYMYY